MLIKTIAVFKQHVSTNVNFDDDFSQMRASVRTAQRTYLLPVLGDELLELLDDAVEGSGTLNPPYTKVLAAAQEALAQLAWYLKIPDLQLQADDTGLHVLVDDRHKSAYQWQTGDYREKYLLDGYAAIENLYSVLEKNASRLPEWKNSAAYSVFNNSLLRTAAEFDRYLAIGGSYITFRDLRPAIDRAQDLWLRPRIGAYFYDGLIAYMASAEDTGSEESTSSSASASSSASSSSSGSDAPTQAIDKLRKALAQLAIAEATEIAWRRVSGGLVSSRLERNTADNNTGTGDNGLVDTAELEKMRARHRKEGLSLLAVAHQWLDENADLLPDYKNGPGYRPNGNQQRSMKSRMHNTSGMTMP